MSVVYFNGLAEKYLFVDFVIKSPLAGFTQKRYHNWDIYFILFGSTRIRGFWLLAKQAELIGIDTLKITNSASLVRDLLVSRSRVNERSRFTGGTGVGPWVFEEEGYEEHN